MPAAHSWLAATISAEKSTPVTCAAPRACQASVNTAAATDALDVREDATDALFRTVTAEEIEAAFVRAAAAGFLPLRSMVVDEEAVVVALPRGHRLSNANGPLALAELAMEDFVLYRSPDGPGVLDVLSAACHRAGFTPHAVASVPRLLSAAAMVAAGRGVTILPIALQALHREIVVYRELDAASAFTIPLTLIWREAAANTPLARFVSSVQTT